jgi:hypothetical protein
MQHMGEIPSTGNSRCAQPWQGLTNKSRIPTQGIRMVHGDTLPGLPPVSLAVCRPEFGPFRAKQRDVIGRDTRINPDLNNEKITSRERPLPESHS